VHHDRKSAPQLGHVAARIRVQSLHYSPLRPDQIE
jgi:hypothetical protein